ncbi:MAG TPA: methylthioribulose 1-phosphate dehydratase [Steroidobacteraceae bacterium]
MPNSFEQAVQQILAVGRRLHTRGLAPATSGNYSMRVGEQIAITVTGRHKGRLEAADVMLLDSDGRALDQRTPSAEAPLHVALYRLYPQVNAVLHVHAVAAVALSRFLPESADLVLEGYELLKVLPGITTHETSLTIPMFDNSQDTGALAQSIAARLAGQPPPPAYLIRGHGMNTWGASMEEAERICEAMDHLLRCELQALQLQRRGTA